MRQTQAEDRDNVATVLPGRFQRAPAAPALPPALSPARENLRLCITRLATAQNALDAAAVPVRRCEAVESEARQLQAQLNALYRRDEAATGEWIAAGRQGPDPGNAQDTEEVNAKIIAMESDVAAVRRVRPEKEAAYQAAAGRVRDASAELDLAVDVVSVEVVADRAADYTVALSEAMRRDEVPMRSIEDAQRARGNQGNNSALNAANQITQIITASIRGASAERDADYGRWLLEQLRTDPTAGMRLP
jgi:hypothetical protein